ncbi:unnamed protein product [Trichogramma brassicae]|uniref:RNA-directed DNA polymerase n=1 Tax=Trichogramma brassicae TaxID=86971 RepID=A0A6H5I4H1_9HYME|nr:unnamed protein product [Trichogramma brassicae]
MSVYEMPEHNESNTVVASACPTDDIIDLASLCSENRLFIAVQIERENVSALIDPGATGTLLGPSLASRLSAKLKPSSTLVRSANGKISRALGAVKMTFSVNDRSVTLNCKAVREIEHDMILGMDLGRALDVDLRLGRRLWRANEGPWHECSVDTSTVSPSLFVECAALKIVDGEHREAAMKLVEQILAQRRTLAGKTDLIEHHIKLIDDVPIKLKLRRMSPVMWQTAKTIVEKWEKEGVIERSASDYCSAPVLVHSHLEWLEKVLLRLTDAGLEINKDKCEFFCSCVKYLGYMLDHEGLHVDPDKVRPILDHPTPNNAKQLRRFLGIVGWYARFIEDVSSIKIPLLRLLRRDQPWRWGEEQRQAFDELKRALTVAPVLARPDFAKPFIIQCDASGIAIGAVLVQEDADGEHPIVYLSRVLTAPERNYSTSEKECLAILWAIKKLRPYIEGYEFNVITDHSALQWLRNLKDPTGRLARWVLEMQQWNFRVIHRKGALIKVADALSRLNGLEEIELAALSEEVGDTNDPWYLKMLAEVETAPNKYINWQVRGKFLYRLRRDPLLDPITTREEKWKLVVPEEYKHRILEEAHNTPACGHLGVDKTYDRIARDYYWKGFYYDTIKFIQECQTCQEYKLVQSGASGLMGSRVVERPWVIISADLMEFPPSKRQNKYLIVFQDLFTRWIEVRPVRASDGKTVAKALEELIVFRWGAPMYFLSDNGKEFINKLLAEVLERYGIKHVTTAPYNPRANPTERTNRTLKTMIAAFVKNDHRDWDLHAHEFRHAVNTAVQATTKVSPAFLNFGYHPTPVKSLRRENEQNFRIDKISPEDWLDRLRRLDALKDLVTKHIDAAQAKQASNFNKSHKDVRFMVGDKVMRRTHPLSDANKKSAAKLVKKHDGPYTVTRVLAPTTYLLSPCEGTTRKNSKASVDQLKKYIPPENTRETPSPTA